MQFERKITEVGGSLMLIVPSDMAKYLELKPNDVMIIQDESGKKGKYLSAWKKEV